MAKASLKSKLARIAALRAVKDRAALAAELRTALLDRSNIVVAKAAALAAERDLAALVPDLCAAYARFFIDAVETDVGCGAKYALARALKDLGERDAAPFIRGLAHEQFEPVWGGSADTAGSLRAVCADALPACAIDAADLLELLVDHLVDADKTVRVEVVRAIAQTGGYESVLLLRFKALAGDAAPEVFGACFDALLAVDAAKSVGFVERFVGSRAEGVALEAACSLAAARIPAALLAARRVFHGDIPSEMSRAIVTACGASALPEAGEFLLSVVADPRRDVSAAAVSALAASRFRTELRERAYHAALAAGDPSVLAAYAREFGPAEPAT